VPPRRRSTGGSPQLPAEQPRRLAGSGHGVRRANLVAVVVLVLAFVLPTGIALNGI
jgi:hypothetical protein